MIILYTLATCLPVGVIIGVAVVVTTELEVDTAMDVDVIADDVAVVVVEAADVEDFADKCIVCYPELTENKYWILFILVRFC